MATFTQTISEIAGCERVSDVDASFFGLESYPIWNPDYRGTLNHKFFMRFWNREIGFETVEMFRHHLMAKMFEIMPYYNQLAQSAQLEYDPFETLSVENISSVTGLVESDGKDTTSGKTVIDEDTSSETTGVSDRVANSETLASGSENNTSEQDTEANESSESTTISGADSKSRTVASDHPQERLAGYANYATSSSDATSESENTSSADSAGASDTHQSTRSQGSSESSTAGEESSTTTDTGSSTGTTHGEQANDVQGEHESTQRTTQETKDSQRGSQGVKADMLMRYRDTLINIDVMILNDLESLFMGVWDTTDSYTSMEWPYYGTGFYY